MKKKTIIREGLDRFSIVYPYWTHLTYSEDPKVWDKDLKKQINFDLGDTFVPLDMRINETTGGFGFDLNSSEELEILSKYFKDLGFVYQLRQLPIYSPLVTPRYWFNRDEEDLGPKDSQTLYLYPLEYKDYYKLRKALLDLYKIGFLVCYEDNEDAFYLY